MKLFVFTDPTGTVIGTYQPPARRGKEKFRLVPEHSVHHGQAVHEVDVPATVLALQAKSTEKFLAEVGKLIKK